jgi:hypothetical protein
MRFAITRGIREKAGFVRPAAFAIRRISFAVSSTFVIDERDRASSRLTVGDRAIFLSVKESFEAVASVATQRRVAPLRWVLEWRLHRPLLARGQARGFKRTATVPGALQFPSDWKGFE